MSVIGETGVSSMTSGLPAAADDECVLLAGAAELLQAVTAAARTAVAARTLRFLRFIA